MLTRLNPTAAAWLAVGALFAAVLAVLHLALFA
jgi:tetrahydromethanopterin S-methyltransferase subunit F